MLAAFISDDDEVNKALPQILQAGDIVHANACPQP